MDGEGNEYPVTAHALRLLPVLVDQLSCSAPEVCIFLLDALNDLLGSCPLPLYDALSEALGQLSCLYASHASRARLGDSSCGTQCFQDGVLRCELCDGSPDERSAAARKMHSMSRCDAPENTFQTSINGAMPEAEADAMQARLSRLIARVWEIQIDLPSDDGARRAALMLSVARMIMHAHPTQLARLGNVLVQLMALLGDDDDEVRTACRRVLPRLLSCEKVVRVVLHLEDDQPLLGTTLRAQLLQPMIDAMRQRRAEEPEVMLSMMATLGAICCEALFASDECQASGAHIVTLKVLPPQLILT